MRVKRARPGHERRSAYLLIRGEELKARALKAGRFSVFEATENRVAAGLFMRLCSDPEVETTPAGYPWTKVKKREKEQDVCTDHV